MHEHNTGRQCAGNDNEEAKCQQLDARMKLGDKRVNVYCALHAFFSTMSYKYK